MRSFLSVLCWSLLFSRVVAHYGYALLRCQYNSTRDVTYLEQIFFNKLFMAEFNSTLGKYVGYTEGAAKVAEEFNKSKGMLEQAEKNRKKCETNRDVVFDELSVSEAPTVTVTLVEDAGSRHPSRFVCSAYSYYPKGIQLTWLKNGNKVTSDVTYTDELPSGNWLNQIHSELEIVATHGDKISCMVEHASLMKPVVYDWDPINPSDRNKIAAGAAGFVLGGVLFTAGIILYCKKKKSHGHRQVSTTEGN